MSALNLLVVDDHPQNLSLLRQFLEQAGHRVVTARSGEEAIERFQEACPDTILMDVMLPGMGGIEATRRIRRLAGDRWVPIIFVSALGQNHDMVRGLEAGGDDYLPKPIDLTLLAAKILAMQRIAAMQARLAAATEELTRYRQAAEQEQEVARNLMEMMIQAVSTTDDGLRMWLEPATRFSGDLLVASRSRVGHLYVLHADSMGHGLTAALPLLPIAQTFRTMTERGITLPVIVSEMNTQLRRQIPRGYFVSATMACVDRRNRVVEVWNGGNPTGLMVDGGGRVLRRFASRHVPLGILPAEQFEADTEIWQAAEDCVGGQLVLYSDGLGEARSPEQQPFGEAGVLAALAGGGDQHGA